MSIITEQSPLIFNDALPDAVDVVVIGAGIAGTATSYFLAQHGLRTVLCEKGRVSGEQENIPSRVSVNLSATANETSSRSLHFRHNVEDQRWLRISC